MDSTVLEVFQAIIKEEVDLEVIPKELISEVQYRLGFYLMDTERQELDFND